MDDHSARSIGVLQVVGIGLVIPLFLFLLISQLSDLFGILVYAQTNSLVFLNNIGHVSISEAYTLSFSIFAQ